jgi:hypothetical protein
LTEWLKRAWNAPFFMCINFMKVHQPNLPHPDFIGKSLSKTKYADSIVDSVSVGRWADRLTGERRTVVRTAP